MSLEHRVLCGRCRYWASTHWHGDTCFELCGPCVEALGLLGIMYPMRFTTPMRDQEMCRFCRVWVATHSHPGLGWGVCGPCALRSEADRRFYPPGVPRTPPFTLMAPSTPVDWVYPSSGIGTGSSMHQSSSMSPMTPVGGAGVAPSRCMTPVRSADVLGESESSMSLADWSDDGSLEGSVSVSICAASSGSYTRAPSTSSSSS
jgi:hypothetical protein